MNRKMQNQASKHQRRILNTPVTPRLCQITACAFFALLILIGAIPGEAELASSMVNDKLLHFFAYSFLSCLLYGGLTGSAASRVWRTLAMIAILGALDEAIQSFMPYRHADMSDWEFDMLAATVSITALLLLDTAMTRRRMESRSADSDVRAKRTN
jgi:uncharacterized membrane protein YsdA (DUF1294 family)